MFTYLNVHHIAKTILYFKTKILCIHIAADGID